MAHIFTPQDQRRVRAEKKRQLAEQAAVPKKRGRKPAQKAKVEEKDDKADDREEEDQEELSMEADLQKSEEAMKRERDQDEGAESDKEVTKGKGRGRGRGRGKRTKRRQQVNDDPKSEETAAGQKKARKETPHDQSVQEADVDKTKVEEESAETKVEETTGDKGEDVKVRCVFCARARVCVFVLQCISPYFTPL